MKEKLQIRCVRKKYLARGIYRRKSPAGIATSLILHRSYVTLLSPVYFSGQIGEQVRKRKLSDSVGAIRFLQ